MTISERTERFAGLQVIDWKPGEPVVHQAGQVHRLSMDYDDKGTMAERLTAYLDAADTASLQALVIGAWGEAHDEGPEPFLEVLIDRAAELPALKALFVGDMTYEECEISWIIQGDYGPLLAAFTGLEVLRIRGSTSLELPAFRHDALRELAIECGGLPREISEALASSTLPKLETLELWLGTDDYGFDGDVDLVRRVVAALRGPALKTLGLRDAEIADDVATWLAGEPWVAGLQKLDLSLGTLGDAGAEALCGSAHVARVPVVDLSHHYISPALQERLRAAVPGVVLDDAQAPDDEDRYVAVGE